MQRNVHSMQHPTYRKGWDKACSQARLKELYFGLLRREVDKVVAWGLGFSESWH
jgi:hypothetical protein